MMFKERRTFERVYLFGEKWPKMAKKWLKTLPYAVKCPFLNENVDENAVSGKEVSTKWHFVFGHILRYFVHDYIIQSC